MINNLSINGVVYTVVDASTAGATPITIDGVQYYVLKNSKAETTKGAVLEVQAGGRIYDIKDVEDTAANAKAIADEITRAIEAEGSIKGNAMQYNTLGVNVYADKAEIHAKSINGNTKVVEFPAATTESAGVMSAEDKKKINYSIQSLELVQHRQFNLFKIDAANPEYNTQMHNIDNAVKELYIKTKRDNLKVGLLQKEGVEGAPTSKFVVWDSDTSTFYVNVTEAEAAGTKLYETDEYTVVIDWDKVNFKYTNLTESRYIVSDNVFSEYYSFNRLINNIGGNIEDIGSNIETIKNDVDIVESALTEITEQVSNVYPCEKGSYTIDGTWNNIQSRFRVKQPLLSESVVSIHIDNSFVDKYEFDIWVNDDGYGHSIQHKKGFVTSWDNDNQYKYIFVIGRKKDNTNLDDVDIEEIKSILVVEQHSVVGYKKCATADEVNLLQKKLNSLIIVDSKGGGDFTSLQEAIYNVDDSSTNPKTILVLPGTYVMDAYDKPKRKYANYKHLSIIGTDKHNCIIRNDNGYYNPNDYVDNSCLKLQGNVYLANLTIISTDDNFQAPEGIEEEVANNMHRAYCVHFDFAADSGSICEINNCVLINDHFACVGCGNKGKLIFTNCDFKLTSYYPNDKRGCVYVHDSKDFTNTELIVKNCALESDYYCIFVGNAYDEQMNLTFINNIAVSEFGEAINTVPSNFAKTNKCYGNSDSNLNYQ